MALSSVVEPVAAAADAAASADFAASADAGRAPTVADLRRFRARPDLGAFAVGRRTHVEDPVSARYFELGAEEYFVLRQLDGCCDWATLAARFERRFGGRCDLGQAAEIVGGLLAQGLAVAAAPNLGEQLLARGRQATARRRGQRWGNPLAIKLPGFDPEPLLKRLEPIVRILTPPWVLRLLAVYVAATALIVLLRADELFAGVDLRALSLRPRDTLRLIVAVALVKTFHELGHALTSRRLGGTCREIGLYILCGAPCLYCDVTSMWRVPERWKRIAVGAAGLAVELVIAATAFWLWRASEPGLFHTACLHVAVVASVGTLLVNGNPLLRYDGYFILSDLLGLANLRERADAAFYRAVARRLLGLPPLRARDDEPWWLAVYAAAAWAYRTAIVVGLLWLVHQLLAPAGLTILATGATIYGLAVLIGLPAVRFVRRLHEDAASFAGATRSLCIRGSAVLLLVGLSAAWPWPHQVSAPAVVRGADSQIVYAATSGRLVDALAAGAPVRRGDPIVTLESPELARELIRLRTDAARRELEIDQLTLRQVEAPDAADGLQTLRLALATVEERLALCEQDARRLTAVAPVDGTIARLSTVAAPRSSARGEVESGATSSPLDAPRRGRLIEAGTPLCVVGDPERRELAVLVEESEIGLVAIGARAKIRTAGGVALGGTVREVSPVPLETVPAELVAAGRAAARGGDSPFAASPGGEAAATPLKPAYLVRVEIDGRPAWPLGTTVDVRIEAPRRSMASRLTRWAASTFGIPF